MWSGKCSAILVKINEKSFNLFYHEMNNVMVYYIKLSKTQFFFLALVIFISGQFAQNLRVKKIHVFTY